MAESGSSNSTTEHPSDELIVAYVTSGLTDDERRAIDAHIRTCDRCVEDIAVVQRRLDMLPEIPTRVPVEILERARVSAPTPVPRRRASLATWIAAIRDRLADFLTVPVLVPVAVAALALLVLVTQQVWVGPGSQQQLIRSVDTHETMHVRTEIALVRDRPAADADVVQELHRGARVDVIGEQGNWCKVVLPNGEQGWVEHQTFE
jgi:hypothetical protein